MTSLEQWTAVDRYISDLFISDPALDDALDTSNAAGLPPINVSPPQGKWLMLLARLAKARKILEIGTLGGYSTIWLARALPDDGHLITLEVEPKHAKIAEANIAHAGLAKIVELKLGPALETLPQIAAEIRGSFDLIFIDANKDNNPEYFTWALKLSHIGTIIVVDNVVRRGTVIDPSNSDPYTLGVRRLNAMMASEPRVIATEIQTVSSKGYDGFAIALVVSD